MGEITALDTYSCTIIW